MLQGIGIDITTITRFKNLKNKKMFLENILNEQEIAGADVFEKKNRYWAVMFTIKEAVCKAFKIGFDSGVFLRAITIDRNFKVVLHGILAKISKDRTKLLISKTSSGKYAVGLALTYK